MYKKKNMYLFHGSRVSYSYVRSTMRLTYLHYAGRNMYLVKLIEIGDNGGFADEYDKHYSWPALSRYCRVNTDNKPHPSLFMMCY
jgi:hypothetical protein